MTLCLTTVHYVPEDNRHFTATVLLCSHPSTLNGLVYDRMCDNTLPCDRWWEEAHYIEVSLRDGSGHLLLSNVGDRFRWYVEKQELQRVFNAPEPEPDLPASNAIVMGMVKPAFRHHDLDHVLFIIETMPDVTHPRLLKVIEAVRTYGRNVVLKALAHLASKNIERAAQSLNRIESRLEISGK